MSPSKTQSSTSNALHQASSDQWLEATVAEPLGFADDFLNTVGALVLRAETPTILSLSPAEDFELNTDIIHQWKLIFQANDGQILGDANYATAIKELQPYIIDQQNGSLLVRALSDEELEELYTQTIFD